MPDGKDDALGLPCCPTPIFPVAVGKSLLLLGWLELRQEQGVSDADLLGVERLDHCRNKFRQSGAAGDVGRSLPNLRPDLLDAIFWLLQIQKRMKALRL